MKSFKQWRRSRLVAALKGMQEREVRAIIKEAWPGMHLGYNPGKHPETRAKLNGATSKVLEMDGYNEEEFFERKYGRAKK